MRLCDATAPWAARCDVDDIIMFGESGLAHAQAEQAGIMRVSADGGAPEVLIPFTETGVVGRGPQLLPGENVLFTLWRLGSWGNAQVTVQSLETGARKVLIERGRDARYVPTGHLVYVLDGTLWAVPFDVDKLEVTGGPVPMAEGLRSISSSTPSNGGLQFGVSDSGAMVYLAGGDLGNGTLVWVDREGGEEPLAAEPRSYSHPRISPDGRRLAVDALERREPISGSGTSAGRR